MSAVLVRPHPSPIEEQDRIKDQLLDARLNFFDMLHAEPQSLYKFLHPHERVVGAIRGYLPAGGAAMLVATNLRIMYLDKTPFNVKVEEISYLVVSGITYEVGRFFSHVTLHTAMEPIQLRWVNTRAAELFIHALEFICIEHNLDNAVYGVPSPSPSAYKPRLEHKIT